MPEPITFWDGVITMAGFMATYVSWFHGVLALAFGGFIARQTRKMR